MLGFGLGAPEIILIIVAVLVLFGGTQLPKLARSIGQASKELRKGMDDGASEDGESSDSDKSASKDAEQDAS